MKLVITESKVSVLSEQDVGFRDKTLIAAAIFAVAIMSAIWITSNASLRESTRENAKSIPASSLIKRYPIYPFSRTAEKCSVLMHFFAFYRSFLFSRYSFYVQFDTSVHF